jgi:tripartite-type tricarboxylate transporter receptor subunit TctC
MTLQRISRRRFLKGLGAGSAAVLLGSGGGSPALADHGQCPQVSGKVLRWIVPAPPGGGYDIYSRLIAPFYAENLGGGGVLGAKTLKEAVPDGLTQGLIDTPGLLVSALTAETEAPNPAKDFTILGTIERYHIVWATSSNSPFKSIKDVIAEAHRRPILFGITEVGSIKLACTAVVSFLLGINADFVAGYTGSRQVVLAAMRGEVDLIDSTYDSFLDLFKAGELRALLQLTTEPISAHPSLEGVPLLCGDDGLASRRASELGRDVKEARADAAALAGLIGAGRMVVAPLGLEEGLSRCLEQKLYKTLTDPGFNSAAAAARRSLDVARADVAIAEIKAAAKRAERFIPIIKAAIKKVQR